MAVAWFAMAMWLGLFRDRAASHEYWLWWIVVPACVGTGIVLNAVVRVVSARATSRRTVQLLPVAAVALGLLGMFVPSRGWTTWRLGAEAGHLVKGTAWPEGQAVAWVTSEAADDLAWVGYYSRRPMQSLTIDDLPAIAVEHPDDLVLTLLSDAPGRPARRCLGPFVRGDYALAPAVRLQAARSPDCR